MTGFRVRVVAVPAGGARAFDSGEWRDAIVLVRSGAIDVECRAGGCRRFATGELLWLSGLPLRALHNHGEEPAVLVAVARR